MSVDRTYRCDLCHTMRAVTDEDLFGIYWSTVASGERIELRPVRQVEHHLCRNCISQIKALEL